MSLPQTTKFILDLWTGCLPESATGDKVFAPTEAVPSKEAAVAQWGAAPRPKDGAVMFSRKTAWCNKQAVWCSTFVPGVTAPAVDAFVNDDPEGKCTGNMDKLDDLLKAKTLLGHHATGAEVWHYEYKQPVWGVAARDFVTLVDPATYLDAAAQERYGVDALSALSPAIAEALEALPNSEARIPTGRVFIFSSSSPPEMRSAAVTDSTLPSAKGDGVKVPEPPKGAVRGCIYAYGIIAVERRGGSDLHIVQSVDPSGSLPARVVDMLNGDVLKCVQEMRKRIQNQVADGSLDEKPGAPALSA